MNAILDACACLAFLKREPGGDLVEALLLDTANTCYAHALNLCEVYYHFVATADVTAAQQAVEDLLSLGIVVREDMDETFWQEVGWHKGTLHRISLADCVCLTLARRLGGEVVTSDHGEFDPVAASGLCSVLFIR